MVTVASGTPFDAMARYAGCFVWLVLLPGILVRRSVLGRASDLVDELALGGAIGVVLLIPVWAALTASGARALIIGWPALVLAGWLVVPRLRRSLRPLRPLGAVPEVAGWLLALAATAALVLWAAGFAAKTQLPPGPFAWFPDDYWHLSLAAEMGRRVPPDIPSLAGNTFMYHWFANANIWTMSKASGLDLVLVYARLWEPPLRLLAVGLAFVLGRKVTGSAVAGSAVGLLLAVGTELRLSAFSLPGHDVINLHSPSQLMGVIVLILVLVLLIDLLAGRRGIARAALLIAAALSTIGAKASIPPVIFTGAGLTWLRALLGRWLTPLDTTLRRATAAFGLAVATVIAGLAFAAGGSAGVSVQLFAGVRISEPWVTFTGVPDDLSGTFLLPGLDRPSGPLVLALVLSLVLMSYAWIAPAWNILRRGSAAAWLLLGVGTGGLGAMLVIDQDGASQVYFMMGALIAWQALAVWGAHDCVTRARSRFPLITVLRTAIVGAALGVLLPTAVHQLVGPEPLADQLVSHLSVSLAIGVGLVVVGLLLNRLLRERVPVGVAGAALVLTASVVNQYATTLLVAEPALAWVALAALLLATIGLLPAKVIRPALALTAAVLVAHVALTIGPSLTPEPATTKTAVSSDEYAAALWVAQHAPADDVIATNVHCWSKRTVAHCDSRAYWVTAFTERRALVESWAYTKAAHDAQGVDGYRSTRQPFADQALLELNDSAFTSPTAAGLAELRAKGVRWLYADELAGPVSTSLATLAVPVHTSGSVTIYQLR